MQIIGNMDQWISIVRISISIHKIVRFPGFELSSSFCTQQGSLFALHRDMDGEVLRVAKDCIPTSGTSTSLSHRGTTSRARLPPSEPDTGIELTDIRAVPKQLSLEGSLVTSAIPDTEAPIPSSDSIRSLPGLDSESVSVEKKSREKRNMVNAVLMDYVFCVRIFGGFV